MDRKHPLAECEKCPFGNKGGFVPTMNLTPIAKVAIIGEAPGAYESAYGIPFTGPSGDLLNQVLNHHGLKRDEVMITNSVLCRPTANEDPPKAALTACAPRLHQEIKESGVDTIIALGKPAAHSLLDDKGSMRKLRVGPPKQYKKDNGVKVIPTWHPAYCLRSPDAFPDLVKDVGKVRKDKKVDWTEPDYRVFDDPVHATRVVKELGRRFDRLVIDIECGIEKDNSFVHPSEYPLLCVGVSFAPRQAVVFGENAVNDATFRNELRNVLSNVKIIAHNGKFDLAGLRNVVGRQQLRFDTMLASYSLDERGGHHGLKALSIERLGAPDYEAEIKKYVPRGGNYANIPRDILYKYNAFDVVCTWLLYQLFDKEMSGQDKKKHDFLVQAANTLIELELNGIHFDEKYSESLNDDFVIELEKIEKQIEDLIGYQLNPRSPQQVTTYYATQKLILPTTEHDFLVELSEKLDGEPREFTELLLHHRKRAKLYGTYVRGLAKRVSHGKIYTTYLLHGTTSGRLSSRDPNLQNVVREKYIRNQFTASSPDHVLVQLDYKQAEGRVIATLARDEYLRGIFVDPARDIFNEFCNDIFGVGKWNKENRVAMKSIFYGNAYGRGSASITRELQLQGLKDITEVEVSAIMRDFNALIPGVVAWQAAIKNKVLDGEDLVTPFGRRRSFWLITDKNRADVLNEALSFLPQSIASDICLEALIDVQPKLVGIATMRLTIHDALVFECEKAKIGTATELVKEAMLASARRFTEYVPFAVDVSTGYRWGEL